MIMREIKFRAWDGKKMYLPANDDKLSALWDKTEGTHLVQYIESKDGSRAANDEGCLLMQFTGLKDKHNNDIFEGDIVKRPSSNGTAEQMAYGSIKENKGCYYIDFGGGYWTHGLLLYHFANCEVIGNIHQHPELLK
jgi:uncharacterized phage protein (TIGR01671 family)